MSEVVETVALISDRVEASLIVDADNGYGNALNVERTVRLFEKAGAHAIQLEDQGFPKRCGHLDDKSLISADEMIGKIKAAVDIRRSRDTLIIARTDAVAVEGLDRAIERASMYREAGADVLFVEAPKTREDLAGHRQSHQGDIPLMANMVEGGKTPILSGAELRSARLLAGDLPRRDRAHAGANRRRLLRVAGRPPYHAALPRSDVRLQRHECAARNTRNDRAWQALRR